MANAARNQILRLLRRIRYERFRACNRHFCWLCVLYWGWQISQNGWGKLHNLPHVTEFFASLGLPAPGFTATFVSTFEFLAGILLILGLFSQDRGPGFGDRYVHGLPDGGQRVAVRFYLQSREVLYSRSLYVPFCRLADFDFWSRQAVARHTVGASVAEQLSSRLKASFPESKSYG